MLIDFASHASNIFFHGEISGFGAGQLGVMLFFVLSGFLIAHLYMTEPADAPNKSDLRKLGELIDEIEVAMLATCTGDGPRVSRPMPALKLDANGKLILFTAADSHQVEHLTDDAGVNLACAHPGQCRYVSVRGRGSHGPRRRHHP